MNTGSELNGDALLHALKDRLENGRVFTDRARYVGASEVGTCLRHLVAHKLDPMAFDPASMGRMLAGRALENEIIQLCRHIFGGRLRETGRSQRELEHPTVPLRGHPDARILDEERGDGILEVKTASAASFKRYQDSGLPSHYLDQVQALMGLSGLRWAVVILASREDLSQVATFRLDFDPWHYAELEDRARRAGDHLAEGTLPEGEPDRGFCHTCPLAGQCEALQIRREAGKSGEVPEVLRAQLDAQVEELTGLETELEPMQARATELRDQIRLALDTCGAGKVSLESATLLLVESNRTSFDGKAFQKEAPELYYRFLKTKSFTTLRICRKGGQPWSTAS